MSVADFQVIKAGSFVHILALSGKAESAPDRLFKEAEPFTQVTDRKAWTVLPGHQSALFQDLQEAGYILDFQ